MPTFTVHIGGQLDTTGRNTAEPPLTTQTAIAATSADWDGVTHGSSEVAAVDDE